MPITQATPIDTLYAVQGTADTVYDTLMQYSLVLNPGLVAMANAAVNAYLAATNGLALPTPELLEGFNTSVTDFTTLSAGVARSADTTWHPEGAASMNVIGAASNATATAQRVMPGTTDVSTWGTMAILLNVKDSAALVSPGINVNKGSDGGTISKSGYRAGGVAGNETGTGGAKLRDGPNWIAGNVPAAAPALALLGPQASVNLRSVQAQSAAGSTNVSYDAVYIKAGGMAKIMFAHDDGYPDQLSVAAPIYKQYGFRANLFVARDLLNTSNHLTTADVLSLAGTYGWGLSADLTVDDANANFADIPGTVASAQANVTYLNTSPAFQGVPTIETRAVCYTGGLWNEALCVALEAAGFLLARTTEPGHRFTRFGPTTPSNWMTFHGYGMGGKTLTELKAAVDKAVLDGTTVLFYAHHVLPSPGGADVGSAVLDALLAYTKTTYIDTGLATNPILKEFLAEDAIAKPPFAA